jgi:hypothetical protein
MIPIAKIQTKAKPYDKIPVIAYFEPVHGLGFVPTDYVDLSDVIEIKRAMCYEHKSQIQWIADNYKDAVGGKDFLEGTMLEARYRGHQCGVQYAEAFRMSNDAFRVVPRRVLP